MEWDKGFFCEWGKLHGLINIGERVSYVSEPSAQSEFDVFSYVLCELLGHHKILCCWVTNCILLFDTPMGRPGTCHRGGCLIATMLA